jgi:hypothetical protein
VTRDQLRALELTDTAIARRVHAGRLHRVRRAVYAVGHPALGAHGLWLAAVLAHGPGALLSHPSAAALWELRPAGTTETHVTVADPGGADRRASGSSRRPHRYRGDRHAPRDPGDQPGAILDLPAGLSPRALERVLDRADRLRLVDRAERMLALCSRHGLRRPMVNQRVAGLEVDRRPAADRRRDHRGGAQRPRPSGVKLLHTVEAAAVGSGSSWTSIRVTHFTH